LIAGGAFTNAAALVANCIAAWDGTNWTTLGGGFSHGLPKDNYFHPVPTSVNALAATPEGVLYAAGNFTFADGRPANFISYWDGGAWQALGSGFNLIAYALALNGSDLLVGGDFTTAGNKRSSRLALWHGADDAPQLQIRLEGGEVILWWPTNIPNFGLETASHLAPGTSWLAVPTTVAGPSNIATNSNPGGSGF
jgi:hypothetical protein